MTEWQGKMGMALVLQDILMKENLSIEPPNPFK